MTDGSFRRDRRLLPLSVTLLRLIRSSSFITSGGVWCGVPLPGMQIAISPRAGCEGWADSRAIGHAGQRGKKPRALLSVREMHGCEAWADSRAIGHGPEGKRFFLRPAVYDWIFTISTR